MTSIALSGARNEFVSAQIVLKDPVGIKGVSASVGNLTGPGTIPSSAVRFYRVDLIDLASPSDASGGVGRWPDPLTPRLDDVDGTARSAFPFDAAPGDSRAIWTEILIPTDAKPGDYVGTVAVAWTGGGANVPVKLHVWNFGLPSTPTLKSYYQLDDQAVCEGHYAGDPGCGDGWGPNRLALIDRYYRLALDHRISLGGGTYYAYPRKQTGAVAWTEFDRWYGPLFDGTASTRLVGAKATSIAGWHLPELTATAGADFVTHFKAKGWLDRSFYYLADEPGFGSAWSSIVPGAKNVRTYAPGMRTLVTTTPTEAANNGVSSSIDLFVVIANFLTDVEAGKVADKSNLWIYDSCMSHDCGSTTASVPNWPSAMIDHSGARNAAVGWTAYRFGATGILYWQTAYAYAKPDAWKDQAAFTGNGDGTYFYPGTPAKVGGTTHTPVASQRLKLVREGIQAYEYLAMVAKAGDPALAAAQAKVVALSASSFDAASADRMAAARIVLATRLEALLGTPVQVTCTDDSWCGPGYRCSGGVCVAIPPAIDAGTGGGTPPGPAPDRTNPIWGILIALASVGGALGAAATWFLKFRSPS